MSPVSAKAVIQNHSPGRIAPATGGEGRVITVKPGHYIEPAFSPDGSKVFYRTTSDGFLRPATWSGETVASRVVLV